MKLFNRIIIIYVYAKNVRELSLDLYHKNMRRKDGN